ncbi:MAG: glycogen/starch synthase, partial [Planctomycetota bacterium]
MAKLRVLHVSMECVPFAKVGGMADVVGALPGALREIGVEGAVLLPYYPQVYAGDPGPEIATFDIGIGGYVHHVRIRNPEPYVFLVDLPAAFDR